VRRGAPVGVHFRNDQAGHNWRWVLVALGGLSVLIASPLRAGATLLPASLPALPSAARAAVLPVFVEGLAAGWQDWSWNSAVNPFQSEPVRSGRRSLAWYPFGGGAGLKLHSDQPVDPARYPFLEFWAQARAPATGSYSVMLFGRDETPLGRSIPLAAVGGDPVADHWTQYRLALADFGIAGAPISSFAIVETSGWGSPGVYFDDIVFTSGLSAAPPPAPLPETANDWVVYGDVLGFGWRNYSWGGEAQFDYTADRAEGSRAIRFAPSEGYGSLSLYRDPPVDTFLFSALQFSARASSGSAAYGVVL